MISRLWQFHLAKRPLAGPVSVFKAWGHSFQSLEADFLATRVIGRKLSDVLISASNMMKKEDFVWFFPSLSNSCIQDWRHRFPAHLMISVHLEVSFVNFPAYVNSMITLNDYVPGLWLVLSLLPPSLRMKPSAHFGHSECSFAATLAASKVQQKFLWNSSFRFLTFRVQEVTSNPLETGFIFLVTSFYSSFSVLSCHNDKHLLHLRFASSVKRVKTAFLPVSSLFRSAMITLKLQNLCLH